jgi:hypothetical protein
VSDDVKAGFLEHEIAKKVDDGVCAALTAFWIQEALQGHQRSDYRPRWDAKVPPSWEGRALDYKKMRKDDLSGRHRFMMVFLAPKQATYVELVEQGDMRPSLLILAPPDVLVGDEREFKFDKLPEFDYKAGCAYYVSLKLERAHHAVGIQGSPGEKMYFFDSNAGEYEISGLASGRFMAAYRTIIENDWGKITRVVICEARLHWRAGRPGGGARPRLCARGHRSRSKGSVWLFGARIDALNRSTRYSTPLATPR